MKVAFFSNFLTHHQLPFCLEMQKKYGDDFKFVSTEKINKERLNLGYKNMDNDYSFVVKAYNSDKEYKQSLDLALNSDVVIMGSTATDEYIKERLKKDKLTFRYYARIFYKGIFSIFDFKNLKKVYDRHFRHRKNKNLYLLCASSYSPNDFNKLGMYKNKCFKWGYFPETKIYNIDELIRQKENNIPTILWVGRFIKEKHPEVVIRLAKELKKNGYDFKIQMIGVGKLLESTKVLIQKYNLEKHIELVGAVQSEKVRDYMEKSQIFICTSDKWERWGVVLNEAMNSACAVIAYKYIGGVPFLIGNNENGLKYSNFNELYNNVIKVIEDKDLRNRISINAYNSMTNIWTAENATNNFDLLINSIINKDENTVKQGPGSTAQPIRD